MKIVEKSSKGKLLKLKVDSNEESFFYFLKSYLEKNKDCEIVGVYKEHYLIDETELVFKIKKSNAKECFLETLKKIKKDLKSLKIK